MLVEYQHELKQALTAVQSPTILVVGDLMLDRYTWGSVSRISPEAPIPVLRVRREENRLGGAANAMNNLVTLGAKVYACGVVGDDTNGQTILDLFQKAKIDTSGVFQRNDFTTILKHRMIAGHHHLLRMDFDPPVDTQPSCEKELIAFLEKTIPNVDLVLVSDYGKGALSEAVLATIRRLTKATNLPVVVDPKRDADYRIYHGFTLIKPNRTEASVALQKNIKDISSAVKAAEHIKQVYDIEYVVLSLDKDGLLLFYDSENYEHFAAETQEVFDVVGAGDMVMGVLSFFLAGGTDIKYAAAWANLAAGMEIMHVGVVSFTKSDLLQKLELGLGSNKIVTLDQLRAHLENQTAPIIFTNGYFDNISAGHLKFLQQLQKLQGTRVVAINSDQSILNEKGTTPILNERERASLLASIESVDWVIIFDEPDANHLIQTLKPTTIVKGEPSNKQPLTEQAVIEAVGASVHYLPKY